MSVSEHYDAVAGNYHRQYQEETLRDLSQEYPANYFRLQLLMQSFTANNVKTAIEVGVGEGTPLATLASAGVDVSGFDISTEMVKRAKASVEAIGQDPARIILADVEDPSSYVKLLENGEFDALMAMGVMPHVKNDDQSLLNMRAMVKPGGLVFIEFRNKLFSMFTFNRYTYEFIMDDLLEGVSDELKNTVGNFLKPKLEMDKPTPRIHHDEDESKPGYDAILAKFHNPLSMASQFKRLGFSDIELLWYHFHPAMPLLNDVDPLLFREEAIRLEGDSAGWRGMFLCSAFVVQARRTD